MVIGLTGKSCSGKNEVGLILEKQGLKVWDLDTMEKRIRSWKDSNPGGVLVINGALLHRAGFTRLCDCVIYVDAPYEARLSRAMQRDGITEEAFRLREESQRDVDYRDVKFC